MSKEEGVFSSLSYRKYISKWGIVMGAGNLNKGVLSIGSFKKKERN